MAHGRTRRVRKKKEQGEEMDAEVSIDAVEISNLITETVVKSAATAIFTWLVIGGRNNE